MTIRFYWKITTAALLVLTSSLAGAAEYPAVLTWLQRTQLSSLVSGNVAEVKAVTGTRVKAGTALVALDQRAVQAQLERDSAELERLQLQFEEAERELGRETEMYDRGMLSQHDMDLAKIAFSEARLNLQNARARHTLSTLDLEHSTIRAPFDAVVLAVPATIGMTVVAAEQPAPLVVVAASATMEATVVVPAEQMDRLSIGQAATVTIGGKRFAGKVGRIGLEPLAGIKGVQYQVGVTFAPDSAQLRAGQSATVALK